MNMVRFPLLIDIFDEFDNVEKNITNDDLDDFANYLNINNDLLVCEYVVSSTHFELKNYHGLLSEFLQGTTYTLFRNLITSIIEDKFRSFISSPNIEQSELTLTIADKSNLIYLHLKRKVIIIDPNSFKILLTFQNVSESKSKDLAINELKVNYFNTINNAKSAMFTFDKKWKIFNANLKSLRMFG